MPPADLADSSTATATREQVQRSWLGILGATSLWQGLLLTAAIAAIAFALRLLPILDALSPLILAIALGMIVRNATGMPGAARPGVAFSMRRILRLAIVLLGMQLTLAQVLAVGGGGLAVVVATTVATFLFTLAAGRVIGVERKLTELIAAGTSICGASAVMATNAVTRAGEEDVAYAVACVTVFGSAAMLLYPLLPALLSLDQQAYGLWTGASIHEIAQVVAAAFQGGGEAGDLGTVAKLSRVMLLAPMIFALACLTSWGRNGRGRNGTHASAERAPLPWFVLGFVAVVGVNSLEVFPTEAKSLILQANGFLLSMALAAMGLETDVRKLARKGVRPLFLGAASSLFIATFSLLLIKSIL